MDGETTRGLRLTLLILIAAVGLICYGSAALAQETQQQPEQKTEQPVEQKFAEEVEVTGSLIPRPTLAAMSPVSTLEIEELTYRGVTRLEDLLQQLPQIFASQNSIVANGASGTATINLRNLGEVRTLVLIDGRRMTAGDYFSPGADLNFIPAALVKRVDILTGGASAVYGADAVAGVVNFILDKDFEGFRGGIEFGGYNHNNDNKTAQAINAASGFSAPEGNTWDGAIASTNLAFGGKFAEGRGHASFYLDYRDVDTLRKDARDYTNCSSTNGDETGPACGGSSTSDLGRFEVYRPNGTRYGSYKVQGTEWVNRAGYVWNYAPYNFLQRPDKRWTAGGFLNYQFNEHAEAYGEVMFMNDKTDAQIAPSGDFFGNTLQLNVDNPMLSEQQRNILLAAGWGAHDIATVIIGRRSVESGGRQDRLSHNSWRFVTGLKGDIDKVWSYDVNGVLAESSAPESYANDFGKANILASLIVDGNPSDPSTWQCRDPVARANGCVPWNIFRTGGVTQEAIDYLAIDYMYQANTKTQVLTGKVTGDLGEYGWTIPSAAEGIQVAVGADYGVFSMSYRPDMIRQTGGGAGSGSRTPPVEGSYNVKEFFAEALIPIIQEARFAKDLSLELGYRWSDYSTTGGWPTYKVQASWAPSGSLKFRGGINRATRSPNVRELFVPQGLALGGSTDPCAGTSPTATPAQCALTGVTAAQYGSILENPAGQYNTLTGGNPLLDPEVADTTSFGLVITPAGSSFTAALDYYTVKVKDTIGSLLADDIINSCITTGNPTMCGLINRDRFGSLWIVEGEAYTTTTNINVGGLTSEGLDLNLGYVMPAGNSVLSFNLIGTYLLKNTTDTGLYSYDCVGYFGDTCNNFYGVVYGLTPTWRHLARMSWEKGNMVLSLGWRMLDKVKNQGQSSDPDLPDIYGEAAYRANDSWDIPMTHYFDLAFNYKLWEGTRLTLGVNNILDKEPPMGALIDNIDYGPGFWGAYDVYGRYVFTGIQFAF